VWLAVLHARPASFAGFVPALFLLSGKKKAVLMRF
jgi:hypothetical protein